MRLSAFWRLMEDEFGPGYARTLANHHVLGQLGGVTASAALEAGTSPREVWQALCVDLDVPVQRRWGRDVPPVA
ncbi:MAG TPA: DUF3046 domain-containing protein [Dermatophilaceae bacterium]|nr:DUF3046 domain-containing protein [Dermatophilaceae bacterium]